MKTGSTSAPGPARPGGLGWGTVTDEGCAVGSWLSSDPTLAYRQAVGPRMECKDALQVPLDRAQLHIDFSSGDFPCASTWRMNIDSATVGVPDLPGCIAVGETRVEVAELIHEAIEFHLAGMKEDGLPIPEPHSTGELVEVHA